MASAKSSLPDTSIPDGLLCPISRGLFDSPVVFADGVTYDKASKSRTSAVSRIFFVIKVNHDYLHVKQVKYEKFSCLSFAFNFLFKRFVLQA